MRNVLAFVIMARGLPIVYHGTEARMRGESYGGGWRPAQWGIAGGFDSSNPHYQLIRALLRLRADLARSRGGMRVVRADADALIFTRGDATAAMSSHTSFGSLSAIAPRTTTRGISTAVQSCRCRQYPVSSGLRHSAEQRQPFKATAMRLAMRPTTGNLKSW